MESFKRQELEMQAPSFECINIERSRVEAQQNVNWQIIAVSNTLNTSSLQKRSLTRLFVFGAKCTIKILSDFNRIKGYAISGESNIKAAFGIMEKETRITDREWKECRVLNEAHEMMLFGCGKDNIRIKKCWNKLHYAKERQPLWTLLPIMMMFLNVASASATRSIILEPPENYTVFQNDTPAIFYCYGNGFGTGAIVTWTLNGTGYSTHHAQRGITVVIDPPTEATVSSRLSIPSNSTINNNTQVVCRTSDVTLDNRLTSEPANLTIQGILDAPRNFSVNLSNTSNTTFLLSWGAPFSLNVTQSSKNFNYTLCTNITVYGCTCMAISSDPDCTFPRTCTSSVDFTDPSLNGTNGGLNKTIMDYGDPIQFTFFAVNGAGKGNNTTIIFQRLQRDADQEFPSTSQTETRFIHIVPTSTALPKMENPNVILVAVLVPVLLLLVTHFDQISCNSGEDETESDPRWCQRSDPEEQVTTAHIAPGVDLAEKHADVSESKLTRHILSEDIEYDQTHYFDIKPLETECNPCEEVKFNDNIRYDNDGRPFAYALSSITPQFKKLSSAVFIYEMAEPAVGYEVDVQAVINGKISVMICGKTGIGTYSLPYGLLENKLKGAGDDESNDVTKDKSENLHRIIISFVPELKTDQSDNYFAVWIANIKEKNVLGLYCINCTVTRQSIKKDSVKELHCKSQKAIVETLILSQDQMLFKFEKDINDAFHCFKKQLHVLQRKIYDVVLEHFKLLLCNSNKKKAAISFAPEVHDEEFVLDSWTLAIDQFKNDSRARLSKHKNSSFIFQDRPPSLLRMKAQVSKRIQDLKSLCLSTTDGNTQPQSIVMNLRCSSCIRVQKLLKGVNWFSAAVGSLESKIGAGVTVRSSAYNTTSVYAINAGRIVEMKLFLLLDLWLLQDCWPKSITNIILEKFRNIRND